MKAAVDLLDGGATVPFIARYRKEVDRRPRRRPAPHPGGAARLPAGAGGAAGGDPRVDRGAGQARRRPAGRRSWPPTPRPAWRTSTSPTSRSAAPRRRSPGRRASSRWPTALLGDPTLDPRAAAAGLRRRRQGRGRRRRRPRRRPGHPRRALRRGRRPHRRAPGAPVAQRPADVGGAEGPGGGGRQVLRLLRLLRGRSPGCRPTGSWPCSGARRRRSSTSPSSPTGRSRARLRGPHRRRFGVADEGRPADAWLAETVRWAWKTRISVHLGIDVRTRLRQAAEDGAVRVFATNLRDLLLAAPAGSPGHDGARPGACGPA